MHTQRKPCSPEQHVPGRRALERLPAAAGGLRAEISIKNFGPVPVPLIDFNTTSLAVDVTALPNLETLASQIDSITVTHGTRTVRRLEQPNVILRQKGRQCRLIVLLNPTARTMAERRYSRIPTRDHFKPFVWVADPLHIGRIMHFQVDNFHADGLQLRTSLSNKHLLVGSLLEHAQLLLPGIGAVTIHLVICHAARQAKYLMFGCRFHALSKQIVEMLAQYAILGGDDLPPQLSQRKALLKAAGLTTRALAKPCTIKVAETPQEFEQILQVRLAAYQTAAKTPQGATTAMMQDEYDDASIIYCAKHGADVIATMRVNLCKHGAQTFPFEKYFGSCESLDIVRHTSCEISKLAILPAFQGSDLFVGFVKVTVQILVQLALEDMFCVATNKLSPLYQKIGGERLGNPVRHPVLSNEFLSLHRIKTVSFVTGSHIDFDVWKKISAEAISHLTYHGFLSSVDIQEPTPVQGIRDEEAACT